MKRKALIIFSGLPGSGKSTLASRLASYLDATYLRIDTIEQGLKDVCGLSQIDGMGYRLSYRIAQENLLIGNTVIADSVNPWELTRKEWNNVAREMGAQYLNIEIICSDKTEHQSRLENRTETIPGLHNPSWQEVLERDYHPWTMERIRLDTAGKTIEVAFQELVTLIPSSYFRQQK